MTQPGLAVAAGLSVSFVAKMEQGRVEPPSSTVVRLARVFGVNLDEFDNEETVRPRGKRGKGNK
jgi:transcriptional regulator with XRE-family HTH domain